MISLAPTPHLPVQKLIADPHHPGDKENNGAVVDGNDDDFSNYDDEDEGSDDSGDTNISHANVDIVGFDNNVEGSTYDSNYI